MEIKSIRMYLLRVRGNATCVVVHSMSVAMHRLICVRDADMKDISTNTVHNKSGFSLQDNHQLYHLCSHGRKVL